MIRKKQKPAIQNRRIKHEKKLITVLVAEIIVSLIANYGIG